MIRVLVAEDQAMVRGALSALLSREKDIEVVAEVARGDEVVKAALATLPDVALLDIEMPGGDGLAAAQALRAAICAGPWEVEPLDSCSKMHRPRNWRARSGGG